jgi:hypothetical protein
MDDDLELQVKKGLERLEEVDHQWQNSKPGF